MAGKQAEITTREKAAVIYHIVTGEPWTECYKIASRESFEKINNSKYLSRYSTSWKQSHKIQVYAEEIAAILDNKRKKEINEAIEKEARKRGEESEHNQNRKKNDPDIIDYSDPKNRQRLYNEIIATAKDDPKTRLDAAKVKWLTGGDTITARGLYAKKPVTWKPSHKIVIQSNYLPEIPDAMDSGIRRRLVIVPFNASGIITDPALKSRLQQPEELQHVLCWLLEGHRKWRQDGLGSESREMEEIRTRYYADNDPLSQWLEERCIEGPGYELLLKDGLIDFNSWLAGKAVNRKRFIDDMLAHGFKKKRTRAGTAFDGLQLFDIFN